MEKWQKISNIQKDFLLGVHLSTSNGIQGIFEEARRLKINAFQFFLGSPRVWKNKVFNEEEKDIFLRLKDNFDFICVHAPYLLNFASKNENLFIRSIDRAVADIFEMKKLKITNYVFHPGTSYDINDGVKRIKEAIGVILEKNTEMTIVVENTAGERNDIGKNLEELAEIVLDFGNNVGICLDTCHLLASGVALYDEFELDNFYRKLKSLKLDERLVLIHANDSKFGVGQMRDRHTHIGEGYVGKKGFFNLLKHPFFSKFPFILETPKENNMDEINLERLRKIFFEVKG